MDNTIIFKFNEPFRVSVLMTDLTFIIDIVIFIIVNYGKYVYG